MGLTLPGASSIPAADSGHPRMASACGERIVEMIWEDLKPSQHPRCEELPKRPCRLYGARRLDQRRRPPRRHGAPGRRRPLNLDDMSEMAGKVPVCANLFPSGEYLMEDFYFAGGLLASLKKLEPHLDPDAHDGKRQDAWREYRRRRLLERRCHPRPVDNPVVPLSRGKTLAVLRGNLAPNGAVMKSSAANPQFLKHVGPAIVFDSPARR